MVATTSDDFDQLFDSIKKQYKYFVPAAGLFWTQDRGGYDKHGLRIESPAVMLEFVDDTNFGTDPEGFLFFDSIKDFNPSDDSEVKSYYNIYYSTTTKTEKKAVVVQFFLNNDTSGPYYAQFVARDPNGVVDYTVDKSEGAWVQLKIGSASAHVKKYSDKDTINVYIPSIEKKATFKVKKTYTGSNPSTSLNGIRGLGDIHVPWGDTAPGIGGYDGGWRPSVGGFNVRTGGGGFGGGSGRRRLGGGDGGINPHGNDPEWPLGGGNSGPFGGDTGTGTGIGTGGPVIPPGSNDKNDKWAVDVWGNILFKKISALANPGGDSYADYNSGRILFYPESGWNGSVDFTAVFFPLETADIQALGDKKFEADTVTWSDYKP